MYLFIHTNLHLFIYLFIHCFFYSSLFYKSPYRMEYDDIPPTFYHRLQMRILSKVTKHSFGQDCWMWIGSLRQDGRYGRVCLFLKGKRRYVNAHRAAYIAFNHRFDFPDDISHLCHKNLCVNPDHLVHEPHFMNLDRRNCVEAGICKGHGDHRPCLFLMHKV